MQPPVHSLPSLFKQLGLPDDPVSIEKFVAVHSPLKHFAGFNVREFFRAPYALQGLNELLNECNVSAVSCSGKKEPRHWQPVTLDTAYEYKEVER